LLDGIDWAAISRSIEGGTRWVGHSDFTALQLGLLAHAKGAGAVTWAGPLACGDFGGEAVDDITEPCFVEAMDGSLEAVGFRTEPGFDGLAVRGTLWGGNLCMVNSLLGTPHWPKAAVRSGAKHRLASAIQGSVPCRWGAFLRPTIQYRVMWMPSSGRGRAGCCRSPETSTQQRSVRCCRWG
jgi:hypothetical protein